MEFALVTLYRVMSSFLIVCFHERRINAKTLDGGLQLESRVKREQHWHNAKKYSDSGVAVRC